MDKKYKYFLIVTYLGGMITQAFLNDFDLLGVSFVIEVGLVALFTFLLFGFSEREIHNRQWYE